MVTVYQGTVMSQECNCNHKEEMLVVAPSVLKAMIAEYMDKFILYMAPKHLRLATDMMLLADQLHEDFPGNLGETYDERRAAVKGTIDRTVNQVLDELGKEYSDIGAVENDDKETDGSLVYHLYVEDDSAAEDELTA